MIETNKSSSSFSNDQSNKQIAIFDQDYWNDEQKNISTSKTLSDVSNQLIENSIVIQIKQEIKFTKQNFYKVEKFNKCEPLSKEDTVAKFNNPHFILKQGYLKKKTDGFFFSWHQRYIVLTPQKLFSFQDQNKEKVIGCVNLKILPAKLEQSNEGLVLDFFGQCQNLILQAKSKFIQAEWKQQLSQVLQYHGQQNKLMLRTMNKFIYDQKDTLTEKQFLKTAQTGDILLFFTEHIGAKVQRFFTNSQYDHVAMVVKLKKKQKSFMVFESNQMHGVSIYDWKQYITYFDLYSKVTLRKLNYIRKAQAQTSLLNFMKKNLGKRYEIGPLKLMKFESDFDWENIKNDDRGYFCSELIAKAYKSIGLLDEKKSSGRYWPVDFSQKNELKLKKGATLGPQQLIVLNKHTKNQHHAW